MSERARTMTSFMNREGVGPSAVPSVTRWTNSPRAESDAVFVYWIDCWAVDTGADCCCAKSPGSRSASSLSGLIAGQPNIRCARASGPSSALLLFRTDLASLFTRLSVWRRRCIAPACPCHAGLVATPSCAWGGVPQRTDTPTPAQSLSSLPIPCGTLSR